MSLREHFHFQTICPQKALRIPESHRFIYTNSTIPSNFLYLRQNILAISPLCIGLAGIFYFIYKENHVLNCTSHGPDPSCVSGFLLWGRVRPVCFSQSGPIPTSTPNSQSYKRVKAEYMHPPQEQSLFFNILAE